MPIQIQPLTHQNPEGKLLERTPEVEAQIAQGLLLEPSILLERVAIKDFKTHEFIKEECVVYLIRKFYQEDKEKLCSDLMNCLAMRIAGRIRKQISKSLHLQYVDDCCQDVMLEVTKRILDLTTDRDDFAQVRFGLWLEKRVFKVLEKYLPHQAKDRITDTLDENDPNQEDVERKKKINSLRDESPLPDAIVIETETRQLLEKEAYKLLENLESNVRTAFVLRHYYGWEIENQDPSIMTISRYFDCTPKTIRNWLNRATEKIQKCQGGQL